jgi:hypothetical protein
MSRYTVTPGTFLDNDEELGWAMVIDPEWTDAVVVERWNASGTTDAVPADVRLVRRTLHAHSARQLREEPQAFDSWWSEDGELASSIVIVEVAE